MPIPRTILSRIASINEAFNIGDSAAACVIARKLAESVAEAEQNSIWRPMSEAPKDGAPILAKIKDGMTIPIDGVNQPFWWSGKRIAIVPQKRGDKTRWELDALDNCWEFGEHEFEGWAPLPGETA